MCLARANDSVMNPFKTKAYVHVQLLSHSWMKTNTSSIILGESLIVRHSSSDFGISLSLSSWPAKSLIPSARRFMISWDSCWALRCCKINQSHHWHPESKKGHFEDNFEKSEHSWCEMIELLRVRQHEGILVNGQLPRWRPSLSLLSSHQHCFQYWNDSKKTGTCSIPPSQPWFVHSGHSSRRCKPTNRFGERIIMTAIKITYLDGEPV